MTELDAIAREYYEIVGWYEHHEQDEYDSYEYPWREDCDPIGIANHFYEFTLLKPEAYSKKQEETHKKLQAGLKFLKEHVVEGMLSGEPYIRELARLIHQDNKLAEKNKKKERAEEFHKRKNK